MNVEKKETNMKTKIFGSMIIAVIVTLWAASAAQAAVFADTFDSGTINSNWWTVDTSSGDCTLSCTNQRIEMTQGSGGFVEFNLNYTVQGDFTATVDYVLLDWPAGNGERLGVMAQGDDVGAVERINDPSGGGADDWYATDLWPHGGMSDVSMVPTSDLPIS